MSNKGQRTYVSMLSAGACILLLVILGAPTRCLAVTGHLGCPVKALHTVRRAQQFAGHHEAGTLRALRSVESDPRFVQCIAAITRVKKETILDFTPLLFPTDTPFQSVDPKDTQYGLVDWNCVLVPLRKVVRLT